MSRKYNPNDPGPFDKWLDALLWLEWAFIGGLAIWWFW